MNLPTNPPPTRQRVYRDANRAAGWGLGANLLLAVVKLGGGALTGSAALIADAFNSLGDIASAWALRGALHVAQQDEDEEHPYGHSKAESIAGLSIALLVTFSAAMLAMETFRRLGVVTHPPPILAALVALFCAGIKEGLYQYTRRISQQLDSTSLQAIAWDHRSDALASGAIAAALFLAPHAGPAAAYIDQLAAIVVCLFLIGIGFRLFARTAGELMDQQAGETLTISVRETAGEIAGVADVEKLRVRKSGLEFFAEIHVQVDGQMTVSEGHRIGHLVKDAIMEKHPRVRDVHVHIEPHDETP
ncbi:cation diffusion facilitator family transporter [Roseimaritima ulvae]|uniref:Ferrous-iron efflux pump FieF n=1 Tax=Roseimaritima ulvae TaxID=980254 RepID=A0A5B9QV02_9BACT|nr:cation diffusion facilitator family transporter [Roseimaritima ulvae]QEG42868.1 Ferrous-iron efflux pump FieF [Roseimaritima ulvae]